MPVLAFLDDHWRLTILMFSKELMRCSAGTWELAEDEAIAKHTAWFRWRVLPTADYLVVSVVVTSAQHQLRRLSLCSCFSPSQLWCLIRLNKNVPKVLLFLCSQGVQIDLSGVMVNVECKSCTVAWRHEDEKEGSKKKYKVRDTCFFRCNYFHLNH